MANISLDYHLLGHSRDEFRWKLRETWSPVAVRRHINRAGRRACSKISVHFQVLGVACVFFSGTYVVSRDACARFSTRTDARHFLRIVFPTWFIATRWLGSNVACYMGPRSTGGSSVSMVRLIDDCRHAWLNCGERFPKV